MALMGEGATLASNPPPPPPSLSAWSTSGKGKKKKKKNSGMIINVVYFAAWLFKYFQTDYRLLQGIIGKPQTIAFFSILTVSPRERVKKAGLK